MMLLASAGGSTVLDRWPDITTAVAPRLHHHVRTVAFHPETGHLDLCLDSPAYATQLRLITARIVAAANDVAGTDAVRTVRVLPRVLRARGVGPGPFVLCAGRGEGVGPGRRPLARAVVGEAAAERGDAVGGEEGHGRCQKTAAVTAFSSSRALV